MWTHNPTQVHGSVARSRIESGTLFDKYKMENNKIDLEFNDEEFRKDFEDSIFVDELDADIIPAELMAEFEDSALGHFSSDMLPGAFDNLNIRD